MKEDLKVTLIQTQLFWEDKEKNLAHFESLISSVKETTDVIVLPEMFNTGFTMQSEKFAEAIGGPTMQWMWAQSQKLNCAICGSLIIKEGMNFYNRFIWMNTDGSHQHYDKRHLFRMGNEHLHYSAGNNKIILDFNGWKICPLICYDLRFPVWSRNKFFNEGYDILLYVANWPQRRSKAWSTLLLARAIENQSYVVGVNRIGIDGNEVNHTGNSVAVDFLGNELHSCKESEEEIVTINLNKKSLDNFRIAFPVGLDKDDFELV
jgi:omega-amidase